MKKVHNIPKDSMSVNLKDHIGKQNVNVCNFDLYFTSISSIKPCQHNNNEINSKNILVPEFVATGCNLIIVFNMTGISIAFYTV